MEYAATTRIKNNVPLHRHRCLYEPHFYMYRSIAHTKQCTIQHALRQLHSLRNWRQCLPSRSVTYTLFPCTSMHSSLFSPTNGLSATQKHAPTCFYNAQLAPFPHASIPQALSPDDIEWNNHVVRIVSAEHVCLPASFERPSLESKAGARSSATANSSVSATHLMETQLLSISGEYSLLCNIPHCQSWEFFDHEHSLLLSAPF